MLEIKASIEKQTNKFWKIKNPFEKSNGKILEIKWRNFGNQKSYLRNQTDKFWTSKIHFRN